MWLLQGIERERERGTLEETGILWGRVNCRETGRESVLRSHLERVREL